MYLITDNYHETGAIPHALRKRPHFFKIAKYFLIKRHVRCGTRVNYQRVSDSVSISLQLRKTQTCFQNYRLNHLPYFEVALEN